MDPRRLDKGMEGWWCAGQLSIDDVLASEENNQEEEP